MTLGVIVSLVGLALSVVVGFGKVLFALGRIEQQLDLLWSWYLVEIGHGIPGGRRRTDPPAPPDAHEAPSRLEALR